MPRPDCVTRSRVGEDHLEDAFPAKPSRDSLAELHDRASGREACVALGWLFVPSTRRALGLSSEASPLDAR